MKSLFLSVFLAFATTVAAQDTVIHSNGFQLAYHPYDFFLGAHFSGEKNRKEHLAFFQVGMTRTFFQQRIYPQLGYQFGYHLLDRRFLRAGVLVRPVVSFLNFNRNSKHGISFYEEAFLGGFVGLGTRFRFRLSAGFGPCIEQKWSEPRSEFVSWFSWNYFGELSWSYAI